MRPAANPAATGSMLIHPVAIGAIALLLVNDHVLKAAAPGWITGKLSDVAGLALTPIVVVALWRLWTATRLRRAMSGASTDVEAAMAATAVAAAFALVKLSPLANDLYSVVIGPTRIDPSDLLALPAVGLGAWVVATSGGRSAEPRAGRPGAARQHLVAVGRVGALCIAVLAIAATSPAPPITETTAVAPDEVLFEPGESTVERHAMVSIFSLGDSSSVAIEARSRWPLVDPAPRFEIAREGLESVDTADSAAIWIDPLSCVDPCDVAVVISVTRPGVADPTDSSIAWELAVTVRAGPGGGLSPGDVTVSGQGFRGSRHELAPWLSLPLSLVLAALLLAASGVPTPVDRRGLGTPGDIAVLGAAAILAALLVVSAIVFPQSAFAPAAGGIGRFVLMIATAAGLAIVAGIILWWRGSGAALAIVLMATSFVGLTMAVRLIGDASGTFAHSGVLVATALTLIGTVALVGAFRRPGRVAGDWIAPSRVLVAAAGVATVIALLVALRLDGVVEEPVPILAPIHLAALVIWWNGKGKVLGVTSFVVVVATALRAITGFSWLFGGPWTGWDFITMVGVMAGAGVTLLAALDVFASYPRRPVLSDLSESAAPAPSTDAVPPV